MTPTKYGLNLIMLLSVTSLLLLSFCLTSYVSLNASYTENEIKRAIIFARYVILHKSKTKERLSNVPPSISLAMRAISSAFPHEFRLIKEIISGQYLTKVNKKSKEKHFNTK